MYAKKLKQDTENDLIIRYQMANLSCFLVCIFGNYLAPGLLDVVKMNVMKVINSTGNSVSGTSVVTSCALLDHSCKVSFRYKSLVKSYALLKVAYVLFICLWCTNIVWEFWNAYKRTSLLSFLYRMTKASANLRIWTSNIVKCLQPKRINLILIRLM